MTFRDAVPVWDLTIIGGGLAGLTAAALAAESGLTVKLLEQSKQLGGRAATTRRDGISFNLGPHALYVGGETQKTMTRLGVEIPGGPPDQGEAFLFSNGRAYPWPRSLRALLRSPLFTLSEKWQVARLARRLSRLNPADYQNQSVAEWSRAFAGEGNSARLLRTLVRLSTFTNDLEYQSAGAALEQLQLGQKGVLYLDHGWQSMVDGLASKAESFGATLSTNIAVRNSKPHHGLIRTELKDGTTIRSRSLILATPADVAVDLLALPPEHPLAERASKLRPAFAASFDVALKKVSYPRRRFALGLDEPVYFSVHSGAADVGPEGITVLHVMKYLDPENARSPETTKRQLEHILEELQPGWQSSVVWQRFLPHLQAVSDIPASQKGGTAGRCPVDVADCPGVFVAGDWVGRTGQLADAAVASARTAVDRVVRSLTRRQEPEMVS